MPRGTLRTGMTLDLAGGHADTWSGRVAGPNPCPTRQPPSQRLYLWAFSLPEDRDRPWASSCPGPSVASQPDVIAQWLPALALQTVASLATRDAVPGAVSPADLWDCAERQRECLMHLACGFKVFSYGPCKGNRICSCTWWHVSSKIRVLPIKV